MLKGKNGLGQDYQSFLCTD